ncbi:C8orf74 isoform 5 [Pan troglodytes]|uniref:C8orf74 isoform 5 n=1 Tax=Pan troglodytes TaxID=9598 RepID=A0A2J8Q995_PANTR|nr:C8orf74 isoform 5 [Pan troglodytes]
MALLTPQGVKEVFQFQRSQGRERLRRLLNWEEFDEQRDSRRSILLDTLYESIIFAVGKGFPWVEVAQVVKFTEELLRETKVVEPCCILCQTRFSPGAHTAHQGVGMPAEA